MEHNDKEKMIRETAYYLWLDAGKPEGQADQFWYAAVTKLTPTSKKPVFRKKGRGR